MDLDDQIDYMAQKVYELCGRRLSDIRVDLRKTRSVEATINRVFDGTFLEGTVRDPSLKAHVILDSDEEEVDERFNLPSRSIAEEFVSQKQQDQDSPNRDFPTPKDTDSIPLRDGDDAIPLLLTGPHSSLPSKRHRRHGSPSTALSSTSLSKELSTSPPPYSPHSHIDTTYSHVENISSLPIQHSKPVSRPVSSGKSLDMPNSDALQPLDSSRHTPMATVASQGTSIFNPIDIDDEDDVQKCNITSGVIPASPKMNTTMHGNVQESSFDHIMCHSAASFTALDFLKEWEYSNSDNDNESDSNIAKALAEKNNMDDQELSNLERQKAKRVEKQREIKERKQQEKEVKQRRKEELKAEKEKQRQLEQANRVRNNRQELYSEMILDVDRDFYASSRGELLRQAIAAKEAELRQVNTMYCTITWHRKTRAAWNEKEGTFIPYPDNEVRIVQESKVLVFMDIEEICEFVQSPDREDRIDRIKRACDGRQVLLMIEGLDGYYKRKNLLQQRNFEQSVIQSLSGEGSTTTHSMRGPKRKHDALTLMAETGPTRMQIEESLTYFQLVKDIMLVPTTDEADSVDWIMALTADIASAIYKDKSRHLKQLSSRCGKDAKETWNKMLQEIQLCTPPVANAITATYPNVQSLHIAYNQAADQQARGELLADIEVDRGVLANRGRTINNRMSKKICTIFTSDDPSLYIA